MNFKVVLHLISFMLMMLAGIMSIIGGVSYLMLDPAAAWHGMLYSALITFVSGGLMWILTRVKIELSRREGIGIVVFGWFFAALFGCLPFLLCDAMQSPFDAFFESCSGLTTTGASVMSHLEEHSRAILLWRACSHLLGGMGILVLVVAIIPYLGVGGMQIYSAEVTGPSKDRLTPRIASTAKLLWGVYILMITLLIFLLKYGGMSWFDSVCHSFATISTGGFSTRSDSIAAFDSIYIETVITMFMLLSGINFALHYKALRGRAPTYFRDSECRFYLGFWFICVCLVVIDLVVIGGYDIGWAFRNGLFYVTSIMTTTGFGTVDYDVWPASSKFILLCLFVAGGCAGSTGGGLKHIRMLLLLKKMGRIIKSFLKPQAVYTIKVSKQLVSQDIVFNVAIFFFIYMGTLAFGSVVMSFFTEDLGTAVSAAYSAIGNIGPGFSAVGPTHNYAHLQAFPKVFLSILMLVGRLEFYTVLVIFLPNFWRK